MRIISILTALFLWPTVCYAVDNESMARQLSHIKSGIDTGVNPIQFRTAINQIRTEQQLFQIALKPDPTITQAIIAVVQSADATLDAWVGDKGLDLQNCLFMLPGYAVEFRKCKMTVEKILLTMGYTAEDSRSVAETLIKTADGIPPAQRAPQYSKLFQQMVVGAGFTKIKALVDPAVEMLMTK